MAGKGLIKIIFFIAVSGIILLVFYHCPFLYIFGVPCPGCGMTRALLKAVRLDIKSAFYYHPLFWVVIIVAIYMLLKLTKKIRISREAENKLILAVCILFIIVYIIRLFTGSDIVSPDFNHSVFYKLFKRTAL